MNKSNSPLFIFEMANNHQGSLEHGLRIVREMAAIVRRYGIQGAVKLQYRDLTTFIHPRHRQGDHKHIKRFLQTELSKENYHTLAQAIRDEGLVSICTPFDEASVEDLVNHGIEIIKVASCSANDWPLLERMVQAQKPIICSTGGLRVEEIDQVVNFFEHRHVVKLSLLHCVGRYPTPDDGIQLNFMERMMRRYHQHDVGYSGHEAPDNINVVQCAVAKGAKILERHVGLPTDTVKLNAYSMNPAQTALWVETALKAQVIGGDPSGEKVITEDESESLLSLRRGAFAAQSLAKGETLSREKVFFAMPCSPEQTTSSEWQPTMTASRDYAAEAPLGERRQTGLTNQLRAIIHQAKGLLREARIEIGPKFTIEMSHHYGAEKFRSWGALIVNLINREYCKKLIIMLPAQRHPNHRHLKKEETFQLLWGDMEAVLDGETHRLKPGDMLLINRGQWHQFTTVGGCIFEEISTTHIIGDSYYEDNAIAVLDPIRRKTVLDMW